MTRWMGAGARRALLSCLLLAALLGGRSVGQDAAAGIRFAHQSSDAPMVDILVNDRPIALDIGFGDVTGYFALPAGRHEITVVPHRLPSRNVTIQAPEAEEAEVDGEQGDGAEGEPTVEETEDAPAEEPPAGAGGSPRQPARPAPRVLEPVISFVTVEPGKHYTAVLTGFYEPPAEAGELGHLSLAVSPPDTRIGVTGPRGFAAELTGDQLLREIQPGTYTVNAARDGYQPATYEAEVHPRRTTTVSIALQEGDSAAEPAAEALGESAADGTWATLQIQMFEDAFGGVPPAGRSHLRVVHASPTSPALLVTALPDDGDPDRAAIELAAIGYPGASPYLSLPAGTYTLRYGVQGSDQALLEITDVMLSPGAVYTFFLASEPTGARPRVIPSIDALVVHEGHAP